MIYLIIVAMVLAGCSPKAIIGGTTDHQLESQDKSSGIFHRELSDQDLFDAALSDLSNDKKEPNYSEARVRLENLVAQFPGSKWVAAARALMTSLDRISALQLQLKRERQNAQGENVKLLKENESLRDNVRQVEDKYSTEIIRLQQENEQLKKDIQQLKKLEIQLEKREKMLR
ncbi:MAG: hypothetical protein K4571_19290 [Deltaproteobacteria bacterium]